MNSIPKKAPALLVILCYAGAMKYRDGFTTLEVVVVALLVIIMVLVLLSIKYL